MEDVRAASTRSEKKAVRRGDRATRLFRQVAGAVRAHYGHMEAKTGAAAADVLLLSAIASNAGAGIDRIADYLGLHKSTVSNLVSRLVKSNMVSRERSPEDQRTVRLSLLSPGRALLKRAPVPAAGLLPELMERLSDRQLRQVEDALQLLVDLLPEDTSRFASQPLTGARSRGAPS